jgi:hypothetical protein
MDEFDDTASDSDVDEDTDKPADTPDPKSVNKRYFKLQDGPSLHGRFSGLKPKAAANKAFSSILKEMHKAGLPTPDKPTPFSLREVTRGSKHKTFNFEGTRKELPNPITISLDSGRSVTYKYSNCVTPNNNT